MYTNKDHLLIKYTKTRRKIEKVPFDVRSAKSTKSRQVREQVSSQQVQHMQVPNETGQGVRRSVRLLSTTDSKLQHFAPCSGVVNYAVTLTLRINCVFKSYKSCHINDFKTENTCVPLIKNYIWFIWYISGNCNAVKQPVKFRKKTQNHVTYAIIDYFTFNMINWL